MQYNYTIFEAEVASTFNEELVFQYLLKNAKDEKRGEEGKGEENDLQVSPCRADLEGQLRATEANRGLHGRSGAGDDQQGRAGLHVHAGSVSCGPSVSSRPSSHHTPLWPSSSSPWLTSSPRPQSLTWPLHTPYWPQETTVWFFIFFFFLLIMPFCSVHFKNHFDTLAT